LRQVLDVAKPWGLATTASKEANERALRNSKRFGLIPSPHPAVPDFKKTYMSVLYGGTGVGKSTLASSIAYEVAQAGTLVGYLSLEMDINTFANRLFLYETGCGTENVKEEDYAQVLEHVLENLRVNTHRGKQPLSEVVRAIRMQASLGCELIFFDNFMMIKQPDDVGRYDRVSEALTALAIELNVHIVLIAHTSGYRTGCPEFPDGNNLITRTASSVTATWYDRETKRVLARCQKNGNENSTVQLFEDFPFYRIKR
jgi:DnaB-like helicase C terminal domain